MLGGLGHNRSLSCFIGNASVVALAALLGESYLTVLPNTAALLTTAPLVLHPPAIPFDIGSGVNNKSSGHAHITDLGCWTVLFVNAGL